MSVGAFVRARREELGMSVTELGERTGLGTQAISAIETDHRRVPRVERRRLLADALRVRHVDLLIAAGELRDDELPTLLRAVQPASECDEIMASLSIEARQVAIDTLRNIWRLDQRQRIVREAPVPEPSPSER